MSGTDLTGNKEEKYKFWKKISKFQNVSICSKSNFIASGGSLEILLMKAQ